MADEPTLEIFKKAQAGPINTSPARQATAFAEKERELRSGSFAERQAAQEKDYADPLDIAKEDASAYAANFSKYMDQVASQRGGAFAPPDRPSATGGLNYAPNDPARQAASRGNDVTSFVASGASNQPSASSTVGQAQGFDQVDFAATAGDSNPLASAEAGVEQVTAPEQLGYMDTRQARSSQLSAYDIASAERNRRAGGTGTFAGDSARRESRAASSSFAARGPDSRDRDRTGAVSKDEARAIDRMASGTSRSSFDLGKVTAALARVKRNVGGQKEVERQMNQAFESGTPLASAPEQEPQPVAPVVEDDVTDALSDDPIQYDQSSIFNVKPTNLQSSEGTSDDVSSSMNFDTLG